METEKIVLLDDNWQVIGEAPKLASHHANTPLHLAFSCFVLNDRNEVLVTQRAAHKKVWPAIWSNTCCGHPAPNESMEDAIHRRLDYELGMKVTDVQLVVPDFRYRCEYLGIVENECCPVYIAQVISGPKPNPEEVMDYAWMSWDAWRADIAANPDKYSYWCKLELELLLARGIPQLPALSKH